MSDVAVRIQAVTKRFGAVTALDEVSVDVPRGAFVTLLGPSGCGKTTLLRIVAGLERADAGEVEIDGRRVTHASPRDRNIGFAFQRYALFPHLTVLENVAFGLKARRVAGAERRRRALAMLELVHLTELAERKPDEISGGQAQRVALARALAPEPPVLLLDEPLSALDLAVRTQMQEELRRLNRELGTTFVFVTHDQGEALTMSDRIVLLREGRVEQHSSPFELYAAPASLFAARFVGEANVWTASANGAVDAGAQTTVAVDGLGPLTGTTAAPLPSGSPLAYVVRPQRVLVDGAGDCRVEAEVVDVMARGPRALVTARAGDAVVRVEVGADEGRALSPGDRLALSWRPADALVFPA